MIEVKRRVSIVGAGPAGFALAADLESHGFEVLIYSHPDHTRHAQNVINRGCLIVSGKIEGFMYPHVTFDMSQVVAFSNLIIVTVPSTGHETILHEMKTFNLRQHTVIAIPGNLFTMIVEAVGLEIGCVLETNISPYSCRMSNAGELIVLGRKGLFSIAGLRKDLSADFSERIERIFPTMELKWCGNIMEVCLSNINGVFHPLMMLMNAGRIESTAGDFCIYSEGLTPAVANAITAVDDVRIQIGKAFGFHLKSVVETSNECYGHTFTDLVDLARNSGPHKNLKAPSDLNNRNISEDVPDLLVTWAGLADKLGIDSSAVKAVVVLAGLATGVDYMATGRNLIKLNLQNASQSELVRVFSIAS